MSVAAAGEEHRQEIIIVRRGHDHDEGHHGGVWKIAFADFMTAMMCFFLVMWLINAANEQTKAAVASYFNPVKLIDRNSSKKGLEDLGDGPNAAGMAPEEQAVPQAKAGEEGKGDAKEISGRLNVASTRVDGILLKVDKLLGSDDAQGVMAQAGETLKSFKQVADTLNSRLGAIMDGLARFSGQGLRDVDALVRDSRRSINRIEQAVTDLERNPQRIITGGDGTVRQYDGRARR
jgi:phospholipid/cholesterol/gamma-HCH transport system substrate-binding protein